LLDEFRIGPQAGRNERLTDLAARNLPLDWLYLTHRVRCGWLYLAHLTRYGDLYLRQ
jgi:hypothetical protein